MNNKTCEMNKLTQRYIQTGLTEAEVVRVRGWSSPVEDSRAVLVNERLIVGHQSFNVRLDVCLGI